MILLLHQPGKPLWSVFAEELADNLAVEVLHARACQQRRQRRRQRRSHVGAVILVILHSAGRRGAGVCPRVLLHGGWRWSVETGRASRYCYRMGSRSKKQAGSLETDDEAMMVQAEYRQSVEHVPEACRAYLRLVVRTTNVVGGERKRKQAGDRRPRQQQRYTRQQRYGQ